MHPSRKLVALTAVFLLVSQPFLALAQQPATEPPSPVIRVSTHVVLVDAIVTDRSGKIITNLKPEEVTVKESGKPQKISSFKFEEKKTSPLVAMPQGILSTRPETKVSPGPMTVILLDALNTTVANQQFARQMMLRYVQSQYQAGQQIAVYALTNKLIRLHDFTGNSDELMQTLKAYTTVAASNQPNEVSKVNTVTFNKPVAGGRGETQAVDTFLSDTTPTVQDARIQTTLAGMRELARQLGGYPGRKNVVWVSTGFDLTFSPDEGTTVTSGMIERTVCPTCPPPLPNELQAASANISTNNVGRYVDEIHRTAAVMADSRVAVYPVDARGLFNAGLPSAAISGNAFNNEFVGMNVNVAGLASSQDNMKELARQTGGVAYYNRNDIDHGVAQAAADGGSYYLISYASANKKFDGAYRNIKVEVNRPGVQVRNRPGYFAYEATKPAKGKSTDTTASLKELNTDSSLVVFDAMLQPQTAKGGKATVSARFLVDPKTVSWGDSPDKHDLDVDFYVLAVGADGKIAANTGKTVTQSLDSNVYDQILKQGLPVQVDIEVPPGNYTVRLTVQDRRTGLFGSLSTSTTVQ